MTPALFGLGTRVLEVCPMSGGLEGSIHAGRVVQTDLSASRWNRGGRTPDAPASRPLPASRQYPSPDRAERLGTAD